MRIRKWALAAIMLVWAGGVHAATRDSSGGYPRGHARHSGAKQANSSDARSTAITPAAQDQRHPEDLALDRKLKSICRDC
jgi:hypothetical protein